METVTKNFQEKILKSNDKRFLEKIFLKARNLTDEKFGKKINFYYTSTFFPPISITGKNCALDCLHCKRKLLDFMVQASNPKILLEKCLRFWKKGVKGVLISGGCKSDFTVPLENFVDTIEKIKNKTGLFILAHTGLLDYKKAKMFAECGIDGVALDVVGSPETTQKIYGVKIEKEKYVESLVSAKKAGFKVISPHVCVGLHFGKIKGELEALRIIASIKPTMIVVTALMPLPETPMKNYLVDPLNVAKIVALARLMFPDVPITLGCARSKGKIREEIEKQTFLAGVSGIAIPTKKIYEYVKNRGFKTEFYGACCGVPPNKKFRLKKPIF